MSFIGIVSESKDFELIKAEVIKNIKENKLNIININKTSVENVQNIKFETIIINTSLEKMQDKKEIIERICKNAKYLILNSDIDLKMEILKEKKLNIITYGLNQKATVTVSSITENSICVALQRNIQNIYGETIELEEINIKFENEKKIKPYTVLIIFIIFSLYKIKKYW